MDPYYGRCYSFNFDGSKTSSRAGPLYGLTMVLRVNQAEYLPWIQSAGIVFEVHDQDERPFVYTNGFFAPVGAASSVGVSFVSKTKLPHPYSTCSDTGGSQEIYYDTAKYQPEACINSCIQDEIVNTCGCFDATFPYSQNMTSVNCLSTDNPNEKSKNWLKYYNPNYLTVDCVLGITSTDGRTGFDVNKECSCPQSCS